MYETTGKAIDNFSSQLPTPDGRLAHELIKSEYSFALTETVDEEKDGEFFFSDWLRNRNSVEFLGIWEQVNNPDFNYGEFAIIKSQAGLNSYKLSAKKWMEKTGAIGIISKAGRYGGTCAHQDIAFEFAMWISPEFKVYMIREFQRLKSAEQAQIGWSAKRELAKSTTASIRTPFSST